jgi:predicted ester cyclase
MTSPADEAAIVLVRRNTEEVQGKGNWEVFDELFADTFVDHTPQPGVTPDKAGVRVLYQALRTAFPDFHADIRWEVASDSLVTTFKIYQGTHSGPILGVDPTGRTVEFETVDVMKVVNGKITDHWGVGNLLKMMVQLGAVTLNIEAS